MTKRLYSNATHAAIPVYADSAQSHKIGRLFAGSSCRCIGEEDGLAIIMYKVKTGVPEVSKVGFVDAAEILAA